MKEQQFLAFLIQQDSTTRIKIITLDSKNQKQVENIGWELEWSNQICRFGDARVWISSWLDIIKVSDFSVLQPTWCRNEKIVAYTHYYLVSDTFTIVALLKETKSVVMPKNMFEDRCVWLSRLIKFKTILWFLELSRLHFNSQIKDFFESYFVSVDRSIESLMHEIKAVVTEHHEFNVRDESTLLATLVFFRPSGCWQKFLNN